ncbi:MAG TPA: pseudouridine synthase [Solirubrobacteraceae bacterium]|nr:pseudouridine synthase [Solirubrobacteraceae bacterium]
MRLAKFLASAGVASRRAAEEIVRAGRVEVDGATITDPAHDVQPGEREVTVDGRPVSVAAAADRVVYLLHKPPGVVSTASDPQGRPTVVSLVRESRRLYPVGRLDLDASGLILLTDDGSLAHRLTHPSFEVDKTYQVRVGNAPVRGPAVDALRRGVELEDGRTSPARVTRIKPDQLEITIHEGRKRQVKRMCEAVGHPVVSLQRTRLGPLQLGDLAPGAYRRLTAAEIDRLRNAGRSGRRGGAQSSAGPARSRPR